MLGFWTVTPCGLVDRYQCFRKTQWLYLQPQICRQYCPLKSCNLPISLHGSQSRSQHWSLHCYENLKSYKRVLHFVLWKETLSFLNFLKDAKQTLYSCQHANSTDCPFCCILSIKHILVFPPVEIQNCMTPESHVYNAQSGGCQATICCL